MLEPTPPSGRRSPLRWLVLCALVVAAVAILLALPPDAGELRTERTNQPTTEATARPTPSPVTVEPSPSARPADGLTWADEFDGPAGQPADPDSWTHETGGGGWGNEELQFYTEGSENAFLDGEGHLVIEVRAVEARATPPDCWYGACRFTSARLVTQGKRDVQYGRVEVRAMLPEGAGIWPAVWMLGSNIQDVGWPESGEIDVMEFVGRAPNEVFGTIHGPGYSGGEAFNGVLDLGTPFPGEWHVFSVDWSPGRIVWQVDGRTYHEATPADVAPDRWAFDHPFFLVVNVAVGGNFGGPLGDIAFPQRLVLDHVRVYEAAREN